MFILGVPHSVHVHLINAHSLASRFVGRETRPMNPPLAASIQDIKMMLSSKPLICRAATCWIQANPVRHFTLAGEHLATLLHFAGMCITHQHNVTACTSQITVMWKHAIIKARRCKQHAHPAECNKSAYTLDYCAGHQQMISAPRHCRSILPALLHCTGVLTVYQEKRSMHKHVHRHKKK